MSSSLRLTAKPRLFVPRRILRRRSAGIAAALLSLLSALNANAEDFGLQVRSGDGEWSQALAMDTQVEMQITGLLAHVTVQQQYRNSGKDWLEGRYLLPLPDTAAVAELEVQVGERRIVGEVREREAAQKAYAAAAANGQKAALVEQERPNLFRTAVANIGPNETVAVTIGFWQPVTYRDGEFSLTLPLTLVPRYEGAELKSVQDLPARIADPTAAAVVETAPAVEPTVSLHVVLQAGVPIDRVASRSHKIHGTYQTSGVDIRFENLVEATDRDLELHWTPMPSTEPQRALFVEQSSEGSFGLLMLLPPTEPTSILPRELILVIDCSGSMFGASMDQAKAAADRALTRLRPGDRFNLIWFNDTTTALFPSAQAATAEAIAQARAAVMDLSADGGTEMGAAIDLALSESAPQGFVRQLVLATDAAISNENDLLRRIETQRGDTRVFPIGIGSAPNGWFIRKAAELGSGSAELVRRVEEVGERMDALFNRIDRPLLRDVDVQFNGAIERYPERIQDLYAGEPLQLAVKFAGKDDFSVSGIKAGSNTQWQAKLALASAIPAEGVARLWARQRIDALEDRLRRGESESTLQPEILNTALQHQLTSRYTSLIAVVQERSRPDGAPLHSTAVANAVPDGLSFAQGATPARSRIAWAMALLLIALALHRGRPEPGVRAQALLG